jgi:hypothetical protein
VGDSYHKNPLLKGFNLFFNESKGKFFDSRAIYILNKFGRIDKGRKNQKWGYIEIDGVE